MPSRNASGRPFAPPPPRLHPAVSRSIFRNRMGFQTFHGYTDATMAETLTATSEDREILGRAPVRELLDRVRDAVRVTDTGTVELVDETALRERIISIL